jgi:hypothetical protein
MKKLIFFAGLFFASLAFGGAAQQCLLTAYTTAASNNFKTNLVAFYNMDDSAGSGATDIFAAHNMTLNGTIGSSAGIVTNCRTSNGAPGNNFTLASVGSFSPGSNSFTVAFWTKAASLTQAAYPTFAEKGGNPTSIEWLIYWDAPSSKAVLQVSANGTTSTSVTASTAFTDTTTFHLIVAEWDGSNIKISFDGGAFATTAWSTTLFSGIGNFEVFQDATGTASYNGSIGQVGYWVGRALPLTGTTSIATLYNGGAGYAYTNFQ